MAQVTFTPQIVVAQAPDGTLYFERYVNGARQRIALLEGFETSQIRAELGDQRKREAERQAALKDKEAQEAKLRHERVFTLAVRRHGVPFAKRTIGGEMPKSLERSAKAAGALMLDLSALDR